MKTLNKLTLFVLFNLNVILVIGQTTPDPGTTGSFSVAKLQYDLGDGAFITSNFSNPIEVRGSVHYPTTLSSGPFPVLVFLHGRHSTCFETADPTNTSMTWPCPTGYESITSYEGYDYLAQKMASHGYIVISVSANAINAFDNSYPDYGMQARGELVQHHLDLWNDWNTIGGGPFDTLFIGKLDLTHVGTMGHSRGGEGVVKHELFNRSQGSPYGVKAVLTLAPVDFLRSVLNDVPLMNVAPYCDGDVSNLQGVYYYDDSRYSSTTDTTPKHNVVMMGANHNFFNTVWTPGLYPAGASDDWDDIYGSTASHCGSASGDSKRFDATTQQSVLVAYMSAFYRTYVGNETTFKPILEVDDIIPPASTTVDSNEVLVSFHPSVTKRLAINKTEIEARETTNSIGGNAYQTGLVTYDICADDAGEADCNLSFFQDQEPHSGTSGELGMGQLKMEWNSATDVYTNDIPSSFQDVSDFKFLQFRVAMDFNNGTSGSDANFSVELEDMSGNLFSLEADQYTNALFFPPGSSLLQLPKALFHTVKFPLTDFTGVDLTAIKNVKFKYDKSPTGAILITDLSVTGVADPIFTSVSDNTSAIDFNVYPNPVTDMLTIVISKNTLNNQVIVYDINGKQISNDYLQQQNRFNLNTSMLDKGVYLIQLRNEFGTTTKRFIKQ